MSSTSTSKSKSIKTRFNPLVVLLLLNILMSSMIISFLYFSIQVSSDERQQLLVAGQKRTAALTSDLILTQADDHKILNQIIQANHNSNRTINKIGGFNMLLQDINNTSTNVKSLLDENQASVKQFSKVISEIHGNNVAINKVLNVLQQQHIINNNNSSKSR